MNLNRFSTLFVIGLIGVVGIFFVPLYLKSTLGALVSFVTLVALFFLWDFSQTYTYWIKMIRPEKRFFHSIPLFVIDSEVLELFILFEQSEHNEQTWITRGLLASLGENELLHLIISAKKSLKSGRPPFFESYLLIWRYRALRLFSSPTQLRRTRAVIRFGFAYGFLRLVNLFFRFKPLELSLERITAQSIQNVLRNQEAGLPKSLLALLPFSVFGRMRTPWFEFGGRSCLFSLNFVKQNHVGRY